MSRHASSIAVLGGLLFSSSAWAIPQGSTCQPGARAQSNAMLRAPMCPVVQDPWQDCDEDPWQLSSENTALDTFSALADPWQDSVDPWQPFAAEVHASSRVEGGNDPWQPIVSQVVRVSRAMLPQDRFEDPWQPISADPWQDGVLDGTNDPWQMP